MRIGARVLMVAGAAAVGLVFLVRSPVVDPPRPAPETMLRAAGQSAAVSLESEPAVIRIDVHHSPRHPSRLSLPVVVP